MTVRGTATDDDGKPDTQDGKVAAIEVSTNGGVTWHVAEGTTNWVYEWLARDAGQHIVMARAVDDSLNLQYLDVSRAVLDVLSSGAEGIREMVGTTGSDSLAGWSGQDWIFGFEGIDELIGANWNDFLFGGGDQDWIYGEQGIDELNGETGNDWLFGQGDQDWIYGGAGDDFLDGGTGNDFLFGGAGQDRLYGGAGSDYFVFSSVEDAGANANRGDCKSRSNNPSQKRLICLAAPD